MGMVRRAKARLPDWPWRQIIGGIFAIIFVVALSIIGAHALVLAGEWHLP
ncbi:hypothetical protein [Gluconobacter frateurii]|uniref:Uncharacterized protein n=1 Tax=Gluconobacter frateurii NRIC 0228 TaxID=1307946 RepID=A0ABQ0QAK8_9PROT|nr:hypothetical protein [Gluconobacter frateurii]OAG74385.1 hypothetical protein A0J51_00743 [Gluconobacter japonicus]GBR11062.1 hypothetical protein AA0228_1252 [Gluconobacter frateurii NRIC 0228]GLP88982.1 hypothetical protein GCM10007868_00570 [Gluconobacter frateurii]